MPPTQEYRQEELEEAHTEQHPLYFEYPGDARDFAQTVDGPFSFRVPNASESALLYATIPDPHRPVEMQTAQEASQLLERYQEYQSEHQAYDPTPEYVRTAELEPERKRRPKYEYAMGMGQ